MTDYIENIVIHDNSRYQIGGNNFTGSWRTPEGSVDLYDNENFAANSRVVVSLANIIPDDGYDYEIIVGAIIRTDSTSGHTADAWLAGGTYNSFSGSSNFEKFTRITRIQTRNNSPRWNGGNTRLVIPANDRNITIANLDASGTQRMLIRYSGIRRYTNNDDNRTNYISNINDIPIGGKNFEGQIIYKRLLVVEDTTIAPNSEKIFDLSDYLPDDDYNYEVLICEIWNYIINVNAQLAIMYASDENETTTKNIICTANRAVSTAQYATQGNAWVPIGQNRKLRIFCEATGSTAVHLGNVILSAYRRLPNND